MNANGEFEPFEFAVRLFSLQSYDINNYVSFEEEYFYMTSPPIHKETPMLRCSLRSKIQLSCCLLTSTWVRHRKFLLRFGFE